MTDPTPTRKILNRAQQALLWPGLALAVLFTVPAALVGVAMGLVAAWLFMHWCARSARSDRARGRDVSAERKLRWMQTTARLMLMPVYIRAAALPLANLLDHQGRFDEAAALLESVIPLQMAGRRSARAQAIIHNNLGLVRQHQSLFEPAETEYKAALATWEKAGPDASHAIAYGNLAELYATWGRPADSIEALRQQVRLLEANRQQSEADRIPALTRLARRLPAEGDESEGEAAWRRILDFYTRTRGEASDTRREPLEMLAQIYDRAHRAEDYRRVFKAWLQNRLQTPGLNPLELVPVRLSFCERLLQSGGGAAAEAETEARGTLTLLPPEAKTLRAWALHVCARARAVADDWAGVELACTGALAAQQNDPQLESRRHVELLVLLAEARTKQRQLLSARESYEQALALLRTQVSPDHPWIEWTQQRLDQLWIGASSTREN